MIIEDEALIIPIRGTTIFWLDPDNLLNNLNVTLVAQNGEKVKVNHLQLASLTPGLLTPQDFFEQDSSTVITTNLELADLTMVANFISYGILPSSQEELQKSIPESIAETFHSFAAGGRNGFFSVSVGKMFTFISKFFLHCSPKSPYS